MLSYVHAILKAAENNQSISTRDAVFSCMREMGLDDFGDVMMLMPQPEFPKLSKLLPSMASADVQNHWTGDNGHQLLRKTCNFVRSMSYNYARISGRQLTDAVVLDYGCGYGQIARLMYYFSTTERVIGVDPWDLAIAECQAARLGPNFRQSDYLPQILPVDGVSFNLAYAFSVFTHLSKRATFCALAAIWGYMTLGSVLCITIRPVEYWDCETSVVPPNERARLTAQHEEEGFAFFPHNRAPIDGEVTYGDTSMSFRWLDENLAGWKRVAIDRSLEDPYQIYVFLKAR